MSKSPVIAIDGYSGTGKSTTAKEVARRLQYIYIDSGAMYRAVTLYFLENDVDWEDDQQLSQSLKQIAIDFDWNREEGINETYLNGKNVEHKIRQKEVNQAVSQVSAVSKVRRKLVDIQREIGSRGGIVMDGRDIGTVVFPDAEIKVFMTADVEIRVIRRYAELQQQGIESTLDEIRHNLRERDRIDTTREDSPLKRANDAHIINTSEMTFDQQVEEVLNLENERQRA